MDEKALMAFIQRILDNTKSDIQAQCMLGELRGMLDAEARQHPEEAALLTPLDQALISFPEVREAAKGGLSAEAIRAAKIRADERRDRESRYNRC